MPDVRVYGVSNTNWFWLFSFGNSIGIINLLDIYNLEEELNVTKV